MPRGPKGEKRPADVIGNAVHVMRVATGEIEEAVPTKKQKSGNPSLSFVFAGMNARYCRSSLAARTCSRSTSAVSRAKLEAVEGSFGADID
jgi:hypothetical protein